MGKSGDIVKAIYDAFGKGDVAAVLGAFDPQIHWSEAENFLYADGNPYTGPQSVAEGVFQRIVSDVENFAVLPKRFVEGGDTVVVEGRYWLSPLDRHDIREAGPRRAGTGQAI